MLYRSACSCQLSRHSYPMSHQELTVTPSGKELNVLTTLHAASFESNSAFDLFMSRCPLQIHWGNLYSTQFQFIQSSFGCGKTRILF